MVHVLGKQRLIKVASAVIVSLLSGGAAWGMTAAATASSHASRVHPSEIDGSTTSSVDETSSSESTTTESTTTSDPTTTTESTTTTVDATPPAGSCNHGADVSKVAHEAPSGHGNEHGKAVSAAAHLKCDGQDGTDDAGDHGEAKTGANDKHPGNSDHKQESAGD
jgi:hypothetical protein